MWSDIIKPANPREFAKSDLDSLTKSVTGLIGQNEFLEQQVSEKDSRILELSNKIDILAKQVAENKRFLDSIVPVQVYHHKKRRNTTVKFLDGTSVTVHRMRRDKDCLYTAVVYAIYKKLYPKRLLELLVKNAKETGDE